MTRSEVHTVLDAALKVADDGGEDGGQVHLVSALSQTQSEQLVPAGPHQAGVRLLTEEDGDRRYISVSRKTGNNATFGNILKQTLSLVNVLLNMLHPHRCVSYRDSPYPIFFSALNI